MNRVKKSILVATVLGASVSQSFAQAPTSFDYTTYSTILTTGAAAVVGVAALLASTDAGVTVWGKIKKYFKRSG